MAIKRMLRMVMINLAVVGLPGLKAFAGTIIINIEGLNTSKGGHLYTAVFLKHNFLKTGQHVFGDIKPINSAQTRVVFENVPSGTYGIASFQDTDGNEDLSKNFLGIPKEPMGFSRNPRITFGPPDFDEVEITIQNGETIQLNIKLR